MGDALAGVSSDLQGDRGKCVSHGLTNELPICCLCVPHA